MFFDDNAFYILGLPCSADRRTIIEKAEELAFADDANAEKYEEAKNILLNPKRRLEAEIGWLPKTNSEIFDEIISKFNHKYRLYIPDYWTGLKRINSAVYNLETLEQISIDSWKTWIKGLDTDFNKIDYLEFIGDINDEREKAKFPTVNENDIEAELKKHRNKIAKLVDSKISKLDKTSYVKLITNLADDCFANQNYDDGEFLNELFDLYDLNIREDIEKAQNRVDAIRQSIYGDEKSLSTEIDDLIKVTKEWDNYAQPLQLRAMSQGYDHEESYVLARKLRDLSLYINNDQHKPFEALKLTEALKDIFAELPEMSDKFNEDITILKKLALNEYLALILQKSEEIKKLYYIQNSSIEDLLRIVDEWHKFSIENRLEDEKISNKTVAEYLRALAVELHNNKSRVDLALLITKKLKEIFSEFSDIQNKLNDDYLSLSKNAEVIVNSITNTTRVFRNNADENKDNLSNLEIIIYSIIGGVAGAGGCLVVFAFTFALISILLKVLFGLDVTSINIGGPGINETITFLWIVFAVLSAVSMYKDRKK